MSSPTYMYYIAGIHPQYVGRTTMVASWTIILSRIGPYLRNSVEYRAKTTGFKRLRIAVQEFFAHTPVRLFMPLEESLLLCAPEVRRLMNVFLVDFPADIAHKGFSAPNPNPEYALRHLLEWEGPIRDFGGIAGALRRLTN